MFKLKLISIDVNLAEMIKQQIDALVKEERIELTNVFDKEDILYINNNKN